MSYGAVYYGAEEWVMARPVPSPADEWTASDAPLSLVADAAIAPLGTTCVLVPVITDANRLAKSASTAQAGTYQVQLIPFESTLAVTPGIYLVGFQIDNATGKVVTTTPFTPSVSAAQGSFAVPSEITLPTKAQRNATVPVMATY